MRYLKAYFKALFFFLCSFGALHLLLSLDNSALAAYFFYLSIVGALAGPIQQLIEK